MANYLTLANIKTAIERAAGQFSGKKGDVLTHLINMVYLTEVINADQLNISFWLLQQYNILVSKAPVQIAGITAANPGVFETAAAHTLVVGDIVHLYGIGGMTQFNQQIVQISAVPDNTHFTTAVNSSSYSAYTSGGFAYHRGVTLGSGVVERIVSAGWDGYSEPMHEVSPEDMEKDTRFHNLANTAGPPTHYLFGKAVLSTGVTVEQVIWSPASSGEFKLRILYEEQISRLSGDTDVPRLPAKFHDAIVAGVVARLTEAKDSKVGIDQVSLWPQIYAAHLEAIKKYNQEYYENVARKKQVRPYML